jgi:hypothetical protein
MPNPSVPFYVYALSLVPGLGHIALERRKHGYFFVACDILLLGLMYAVGKLFHDPSIPVRIATGLLLFYAPLCIWTLTDLGIEKV